ncbi:XTP/dITP diphosphatase [Halalkalibacter akibai]|uniref:dITP/XTP pyrophosphatase n=1 Tax=Halalkalibacter akibai (strain ATCC 43226 / DSM 21942 / CIP 109018 / JCM 9157 / 1139) TaxID=1236973 RepID=W4QUA6_HALA3|nr:XTP/dITP diphosphatase [Halalkalibacter akibai]GAE34904.1 nucleoside 5-triphosphatase RdgB [Halalkalibacter akibai JCM 9157]
MNKEMVIATQNKGKIAEFEQMFRASGWVVKSLLDYPDIPDIEEDGETFAENAAKKAETLAKHLNRLVIADDSGLIVDALNGRPGVYSARYAGEEKSDLKNMEKVLKELIDVPSEDRTARFICLIAVARPNEETLLYEGSCEGYIAATATGDYGFGYDPIFYVREHDQTMAQLTSEQKNKISHRAQALTKLMEHQSDWNK